MSEDALAQLCMVWPAASPRLPALKIYLRLGYQPLLYAPDMVARWQAIATKLNIDL